jgi:hypothetical protein
MEREEAKLKTKESLWNTINEEFRTNIENSINKGLFYTLVPTSDDDIYFYENDIKILKVLGYTVIERDDLENDYCLRNKYSLYLNNLKLDTMISYIPYTLIIWD